MADPTDRGITINRTLAWTMLVSVAGLIWWGGGTLASLQGAAERLTAALMETREMILAERASSAQLEARVRVLETGYPASETYFFAPLNERVPVYQKPFRLTREVYVEASPEAAAALGTRTSLTLSGRLEYQACDDKICYNPTSVPLSWTLAIGALDRERVGGR